ncbi:MAG TPA: class I SAM-dependent methyltransferase [Flavobacteriales bacterium]|jgi:SAM-dependent methyltransferase|nr:class I SAM-dependent methyltransferase [Flavobacteriales bacterium]
METLSITAPLTHVPANYDAYLGPLLFEPFAQHLAQRAALLEPTAVLELACGTGRLTRQLDRLLPATSTITATDVDVNMLRIATDQLGGRGLEWGRVDAQDLPYAAQQFDLVVAQFGVMHFSDRMEAYREALRVLQPHGRMLFTCWDSIGNNPLGRITQEVIDRYLPQGTPALNDDPYAYHDKALIREEVLLSGFSRVRMAPVSLIGHAESAAVAARGLLEGSPVLATIIEHDPLLLPVMRMELVARLTQRFGSQHLRVPLNAWVVEALER